LIRLEITQHQLRVKKLEEIYEDHIRKIKVTIERKLKQASDLLKMQEQTQKFNSSKYEASYAKTLALKAELEAGLDLWRKQVLSVQSQSIRRAEEKVRHELESRREKLAEEMRNREKKCFVKRKEKEEFFFFFFFSYSAFFFLFPDPSPGLPTTQLECCLQERGLNSIMSEQCELVA
jgi:hypothetical protein